MSILDTQLRTPDGNNPLVPALLGSVSWLNQIESLIHEQTTTSVTQPDDDMLYAVLGIFAVRDALSGWLATIPAPETSTGPQSQPQPNDVLR